MSKNEKKTLIENLFELVPILFPLVQNLITFTAIVVFVMLFIQGASNRPDAPEKFMYSIIFLCLITILQHLTNKDIDERRANRKVFTSGDLNQRIAQLTTALKESGRIISSLESEINTRKGLVDKLEEDQLLSENAISLNREQVDAISTLLTIDIAKLNRKDARKDLLKDIILFAAGVVITIVIGRLGLGF